MPSPWSVRAGALVFACTLVLTACTGGGDEDEGPTKPEATPAQLKPMWSESAPGDTAQLSEVHPIPSGRILYVGGGAVAAYSAANGEQAWSSSVRDTCTASDPNAAGDIALTAGKECREVAVINGRTGKVRWRTRIPSVSPGYDSGNVVASIGDRTVTVVQFCGQVTRLSLKDGKRLGILAPHDRACANEADSDGQLIAVWHDPETDDTPDDHGTGWIPSWDGKAAFELYDADTGKRLWRRQTDRGAGGLYAGAVVNANPIVLALTADHHSAMRKYGRTSPKPGAYVGRGLPGFDGKFEPIGVADGVLIGTYSEGSSLDAHGPRVFAYDLDTGRELWSRTYPDDVTAGIAGVDDRGVVLTRGRSLDEGEGDRLYRTWVARWDLRSGQDAGVVGQIDQPDRSSVAGVWRTVDGVLYGMGSELRAYELPDPDPDLTVPDGVDWDDDDVQPDPLTDACAAIRPETLRQLGLRHSVARPTPADCAWIEHDQPEYSDRGLEVNLTIASPDAPVVESGTGTTAVEIAKELVKQRRAGFDPGVTSASLHPPMPKPKPIDGLGDEAYTTTAAGFDAGMGSTTGAYLLIRKQNVVLEIESEGAYQLAHRGAGQPSLGDSEAGVLAAARDVFTRLDLELTSPRTPPDDGRFNRVGRVCDALRDDAGALGLPDPHPVMPTGSDPRVAECAAWQDHDYGDELNVHAYAASGSPLTGKSGRQVAESIFTDASNNAKPLKGLGDTAAIDRDDATEAADGYDNSDRDIVVRKGNLVLQVSYSRWGAGLGDDVERSAIAMTRDVLRAAKR